MNDIPKRANTRANTDEEKEAIIALLFVAWKNMPELRLGQLISNVMTNEKIDLFYIEDWDLLTKITSFQIKHSK